MSFCAPADKQFKPCPAFLRQPIKNISRVPRYQNSQEVAVSATSWLSPLPEIGEGFREWFEVLLMKED